MICRSGWSPGSAYSWLTLVVTHAVSQQRSESILTLDEVTLLTKSTQTFSFCSSWTRNSTSPLVEVGIGLEVVRWKALDLRDLVAAGDFLVGGKRCPVLLLRVE
jgi:hypothetical protein